MNTPSLPFLGSFPASSRLMNTHCRAHRIRLLHKTLSPPVASRVASPRQHARYSAMATTTDVKNYKFNHSMLRVKNPEESVKFYEFLGMSVVKNMKVPKANLDVHFMAYNTPKAVYHGNSFIDRQGVVELSHAIGTRDDPNFAVNNGNKEPHRGFGHVCISVDNLQAACKRIEDAGYRFQKKLTDGRMNSIAFVLDPDGYWVEVIGQKPLAATEGVTETDPGTYRMNHTMIRVKDAQKSLAWYQDVLGMKLLRTMEAKEAGFNLYFLAYPEAVALAERSSQAHVEGLLELTWNYGTEKDEAFSYHSGNEEPRGFGHVAICVDNVEAACARFDSLNVKFHQRLDAGSMNNVAFLLDPDGYWVQIIQNDKYIK